MLSPNHLAARDGDVARCTSLPSAVLDEADPRGLTALHLAALNGHAACVRVLLERGAQVEPCTTMALCPESRLDRDRAKRLAVPRTEPDLGVLLVMDRHATPLHFAAAAGHTEVAAALLAAQANASAETLGGATPLHYASGSADLVAALLAHGAAVDAALRSQAVPAWFDAGMTALHGAAERGALDVVEALLAAGADASKRTKTGCGALFFAARSGSRAILERLVQAGARVEPPLHAHDDPLLEAIVRGAEDCIAPLLAAGAVAKGLPAALRYARTEAVAILRAAGAPEPHYQDLDDAIASGDAGEVERRIALGERPKPRAEADTSPLEHAVTLGSVAMVRMLLAIGEDPEPSLARDHQHRDGISLLHRACLGTAVGHRPIETALHRAACVQIAQLLLAAGVDPRTTDRHGNVPVHYAERNGFSAMQELLAALE